MLWHSQSRVCALVHSCHFVVLAVVFSKPGAFGESGDISVSESSRMGPTLIKAFQKVTDA